MANATSFRFYHDAALTQEIVAGNTLTATQGAGLAAVDQTIYLGSATADKKLQADSDPGVDPVIVSVVDAAAGSGAPATEFRMSLSPITGAETPGAALTLSHTLLSGTANKVTIYTRRTSALTVAGVYTDLSLDSNAVVELPV